MAGMASGILKMSPQYKPPALSTAFDIVSIRTFGISTNPFPIVTQLAKPTYENDKKT